LLFIAPRRLDSSETGIPPLALQAVGGRGIPRCPHQLDASDEDQSPAPARGAGPAFKLPRPNSLTKCKIVRRSSIIHSERSGCDREREAAGCRGLCAAALRRLSNNQ